jgi:hypothetical protein
MPDFESEDNGSSPFLVTKKCRRKEILRFRFGGSLVRVQPISKGNCSSVGRATYKTLFTFCLLFLTGCSADGYTGVFWVHVLAGSNPATQTI